MTLRPEWGLSYRSRLECRTISRVIHPRYEQNFRYTRWKVWICLRFEGIQWNLWIQGMQLKYLKNLFFVILIANSREQWSLNRKKWIKAIFTSRQAGTLHPQNSNVFTYFTPTITKIISFNTARANLISSKTLAFKLCKCMRSTIHQQYLLNLEILNLNFIKCMLAYISIIDYIKLNSLPVRGIWKTSQLQTLI